jgi:nucleotide-binding universal stress UspA family protein
MFQQILLCTDGSYQARTATHLVADLACRHNAHVDLIHVLDIPMASNPACSVPEAGLSAGILLQHAQECQQDILQRTGQIFEQAQIHYTPYAEFGHPVERIHLIARQTKANLIVMGSRGLSPWPALQLGSVAEGVARHAPCPVLIVRGEPRGFHRIVMASDGSEKAIQAIRAGMELAGDYHADVSVLNVFEPSTAYPCVVRASDPHIYSARVREVIARQLEPISAGTGVAYRLSQQQGHPAESLVDFAEQRKADLIVVGSRGIGGFHRLLLGSVSTSVLHHAHCSVLIVR